MHFHVECYVGYGIPSLGTFYQVAVAPFFPFYASSPGESLVVPYAKIDGQSWDAQLRHQMARRVKNNSSVEKIMKNFLISEQAASSSSIVIHSF